MADTIARARSSVDNGDMSTRSFDEFVKGQLEQGRSSVNWAKERDQWIQGLASLYRQVESFLHDYVERGEIQLKYEQVILSEEHLGSYKVRQMVVIIGHNEVQLQPVGRLILGARGRIDLVGVAGRAQFLLVDARALSTQSLIDVRVSVGNKAPQIPPPRRNAGAFTWKYVTPPPERRLIDLTKELFQELLMSVVNG